MPRPKEAIRDPVFPPGDGGARALCSVSYYNICSGWIWTWSGWEESDMVGVVFDLPEKCGIAPGAGAMTDGFWWYWRYTSPGRGWTLNYNIYEVDASGCLSGEPIWESEGVDPIERLNLIVPGGVQVPDRIAVTAAWYCALPRMVTQNNEKNVAAGCAPVPSVVHSFSFGNPGNTVYCFPHTFEDDLGPVEILMHASFDAVTATEETSWGAIKTMFR